MLVFDSWYAGTEHLAWYQHRGIRFVTATKNNRAVRLLAFPLAQRPQRPRQTTEWWRTTTPFRLAQQYPHSRAYHYSAAIDCRTRRWEITLEGFEGFLSLVCIKNYATTPAFKEMVTPAEKKQKDPNTYLLTNATDLVVVAIVTWYRRRWAVEIFFNVFKHLLHIEHLITRNKNGIMVEIYSALIFYLLTQIVIRLAAQKTGTPVERFSFQRSFHLVRAFLLTHLSFLLDRRTAGLREFFDRLVDTVALLGLRDNAIRSP
jgi:hypothetical protein